MSATSYGIICVINGVVRKDLSDGAGRSINFKGAEFSNVYIVNGDTRISLYNETNASDKFVFHRNICGMDIVAKRVDNELCYIVKFLCDGNHVCLLMGYDIDFEDFMFPKTKRIVRKFLKKYRYN